MANFNRPTAMCRFVSMIEQEHYSTSTEQNKRRPSGLQYALYNMALQYID